MSGETILTLGTPKTLEANGASIANNTLAQANSYTDSQLAGLRSNIDGFFGGGGTGSGINFRKGSGGLAPQTGSGTIAQADLSRALLSMPPPVVSVTEIRDVSNRVSVVERMSRA